MDSIGKSQEETGSAVLGLRQYRLGKDRTLAYMSHGLREFLNLPQMKPGHGDPYEAFICPEDRAAYRNFMESLQKAPQKKTFSYRILDGKGKLWPLTDRGESWKESDGSLQGEILVSHSIKQAGPAVSWGCLRCTCEKQPKITYLNEAMKELLRMPQAGAGEMDYMELYQENIFLILPMEERRRFTRYLQRICSEDIPVFGEIALLRCDGTRAHVFGWVTRGRSPEGTEEFQAACLDITEHYESRKEQNSRRYLNALKDVYDKIFQYDLEEGVLKCLYDSKASRFSLLQNIPMQLEQATRTWVSENVVPEEQQRVLEFFQAYTSKNSREGNLGPARIAYHARASSGQVKYYGGIFLQAEENIRLYCCRCIQDGRENDQLRSENNSLKENIQELMLKFTDGIAAFQISDGAVTPLYVTDNICKFFGRTREEWLPLMKTATPIPEFVSHANVDYGQFETLLREGEAEFSYLDLETQQIQRMKAICSHQSPCEGVPRYVMLYSADPEREETSHVYIRTFGYFDVFVDEMPIAFRNRKSKELLALLVDRRGGFVSSEEAISYLWEEEPVNSLTLSRYRKVALRLKNMLMEYGISDIVESVDGKRRINPQKVRCDLYDYLTGKEEYASSFKGNYLTNYSWGESTLAELSGSSVY